MALLQFDSLGNATRLKKMNAELLNSLQISLRTGRLAWQGIKF
jgi:hypothetical protein